MLTTFLRWFAFPEALALLIALPALALLVLWAWLARRRAWLMLGGMPARGSLASRLVGRSFWRGLLITMGLLLVGMAAAGPRWGREKTEIASAARDLVVLLDVSRSMLAETPSRQLRAQRVLSDLADTLKQRGGHRVALVVVAAKAQLVVPLTTDYDLFQSAVVHQDASRLPAELRPGKDGPPSGTRLGEGLREAIAAHDAKYRTSQIILLVSDGDDPGGDGEWKDANLARRAGIPVFVVGVGDSTKTSKIRIGDPLLPLTYEGQPVESTLNEVVLKDIAERTDGTYFPVRTSKIEPGSLFPAILEAAAALPRETAPAEDYHARFRWFLTVGLVFLAGSLLLGDRRAVPGKAAEEEPVIQLGRPLPRPIPRGGAAAVAVALVAAVLVGAARQVEDLLRQGNEAFQNKDYPAALKFYEQAEDSAPDPGLVAFNKGATLVRLGRFREAELCYLRCLQDRAAPAERRLKALYDLGTSLLQRGTDVKDVSALFRAGECFELCFKEATDSALQNDAEHNLELARLLWLKVRAEVKAPDDPANNPPDPADPRLNPMDQGDPEKGRRGHKDPTKGAGERGHPGDENGPDTDPKLPGKGTIETLADSDQLQPLDGNDAREMLAREIRRIEREQAPGPGQVQPEYRNVKDW